MKEVSGDLFELALAGHFDVIVHGCNCFCTMGAGIAALVREKFPEAYEADLKTAIGDMSKLGTYTHATISTNFGELVVVNAYTQYRYGTQRRQVDYKAVEAVFKRIKQDFTGKRIAYPMIGAGLAGGHWPTIAQIIDQALIGENHTFVRFTG